MRFSSIPLRKNGEIFYYHWFNSLRSAGVELETFFGNQYVNETTFNIANAQATAQNITDLAFDSNTIRSVVVLCEVRRKTDDEELISNGLLKVYYREHTSSWELINELGGDDDGLTFTITAAGQVQYISSTMNGANYTGKITFKTITFGA
jgi:hypothetical protein